MCIYCVVSWLFYSEACRKCCRSSLLVVTVLSPCRVGRAEPAAAASPGPQHPGSEPPVVPEPRGPAQPPDAAELPQPVSNLLLPLEHTALFLSLSHRGSEGTVSDRENCVSPSTTQAGGDTVLPGSRSSEHSHPPREMFS